MRILLASCVLLLCVASVAQATVKCPDVLYDNPRYHENMEQLAIEAKLRDGYNRFHEDAVSAICRGDDSSVRGIMDNGSVSVAEVAGLRKALGRPEGPGLGKFRRSRVGLRYEYARKKLGDMGLCNACASRAADLYATQPKSKCAVLTKKAFDGDQKAVKRLQKGAPECE